jgi:hypothetical protein
MQKLNVLVLSTHTNLLQELKAVKQLENEMAGIKVNGISLSYSPKIQFLIVMFFEDNGYTKEIRS